MVFLVTFLSINKKVIAWRLLVGSLGVYEGLSLAIGTPHPLIPSPEVGGGNRSHFTLDLSFEMRGHPSISGEG